MERCMGYDFAYVEGLKSKHSMPAAIEGWAVGVELYETRNL